jgi:hypothetical protein
MVGFEFWVMVLVVMQLVMLFLLAELSLFGKL